MLRWIIPILIYIIIDIYAFQAVKTLTKNGWLHGLYVVTSLLILGLLLYALSSGEARSNPRMMYIFGFFLAFFVPKLLLIIFMFGEDIVRLFVGAYFKITNSNESFHLPSRRKFISSIALGVAAIPFASLLYGMYKGKYNYKVLSYTLEFDDLPEAFDGYTVTQISDVHSGSFDNKEEIEYAVNLVNEQQSDVIFFTGDLVNNVASEMNDWKEIFGTLQAKDGVFSVLGNHDYGDYVSWESKEAQELNLKTLKNIQKEMGWQLLLNEHVSVQRAGEQIKIVGVENWGAGGFKKAGDLSKASQGIAKEDFKILLSHDPSHWQEQVKQNELNYHLTLSGHTHGMQFGIEIPGWFRWSPVKYRYENWAGIYEEFGRYINVNRGFGYLGYPGRVGIWPEISVITLKKRSNTV
ncbi:metallophosphoesterase [Cochleicola gelatinilyticus]|uniref:Phosphoesterase n=1 Tax=Cochleicola gelatinilyticus TaxID=1763537 RepID=A0A167JBN7_9FLAO|nr:metallophosphoesterase [Cochleicola gelatinilyticus]OAB80519.1 phosphoesterase [Cochleicola gelatinilyticus]